MQVSLKIKTENGWLERQISVLKLDQYKGQDAVAKITDSLFWVGNQKWYEHYREKGFDVTDTCELVGLMMDAREIFWSNREERIAIMTAEGVPDDVATSYCDSKPLTYGKETGGVPPLRCQPKGESQKQAEETQAAFGW